MGNKPSNQITPRDKKRSKKSKLSLWIRIPLRFLGKIRNLYVQCMNGCASLSGQGEFLGLHPAYYSSLPSFNNSTSRDANDLQDLIRANSESKLMNRVESKNEIGCQSDLLKKVQRSKGCDMIETIDEDKPCEFGDELKVRTHLKRVRGVAG